MFASGPLTSQDPWGNAQGTQVDTVYTAEQTPKCSSGLQAKLLKVCRRGRHSLLAWTADTSALFPKRRIPPFSNNAHYPNILGKEAQQREP